MDEHKHHNHNKKNNRAYFIIFLLIIFFFAGWIISKNYQEKSVDDINQEETTKYVGDVYKNMSSDLYASITDKFRNHCNRKKMPIL